jgi:hypothetical protein
MMKKTILTLAYICLLTNWLRGTIYYLNPNGSDGNNGGSEANAWSTFSHALSAIRAGDELVVLDGVYNQEVSISISGTSSLPITIRAKNDGQVTIDGQNNRQPLSLSGNYIIFKGIVMKNSSGNVIDLTGDHNVFRRCSAYNANPNGNNHLFCITGDYNLLEDCAAGGTGRYCYLNYNCQNNTLRRCLGKWGSHNSGSPRAVFSNYGAESILMENCIGFNVFPNINTTMEYYGVYQTWADYNTHPTNHCRYYGCIFYRNLQGGVVFANTTGPHTEVINCVFFDHNRTDPFGAHPDAQCGNGIASSSQTQMIVKNCTFVNNKNTALMYQGSEPITNCLFVQNGYVLSGNNSHQYCDFYQNTTIGGSINQTDLVVDPGFKNSSYIYIPDSSPLKGAGQNGQDIGANVLNRYVDGNLTGESLWPWPMNQRILNETGYDVTATLISDSPVSNLYAKISATALTGTVPLSVNFNAEVSGGKTPYTYLWNFGDNETSNLQNPSHIFSQAGRFEPTLQVTDSENRSTHSSIVLNTVNPVQALSISGVKLCEINQTQEVNQIQSDNWYDLYIYFNSPANWSSISYADIWINHNSFTEATLANRGGAYYSSSNYIMSFSISDETIWVKETEGSSQWSSVSGTNGLYLKDDNSEYVQNSTQGWAKTRVKLLPSAKTGNWVINAYVINQGGVASSLFTKDVTVIQSESDIIPPSPPRNLKVNP